MDVGEILAFRIGMLREIAHARPVDGDAVGEIAERDPHRLDAVGHRQQPFHVIVGDDDGHALVFLEAGLGTRRPPPARRFGPLHRQFAALPSTRRIA